MRAKPRKHDFPDLFKQTIKPSSYFVECWRNITDAVTSNESQKFFVTHIDHFLLIKLFHFFFLLIQVEVFFCFTWIQCNRLLACSCFPKINVGFSPINVASTSLLSLLQWLFNPTQHSEVNSMETYSDLAYIFLTPPVFILGITFLSYIFFHRINLIHVFFWSILAIVFSTTLSLLGEIFFGLIYAFYMSKTHSQSDIFWVFLFLEINLIIVNFQTLLGNFFALSIPNNFFSYTHSV